MLAPVVFDEFLVQSDWLTLTRFNELVLVLREGLAITNNFDSVRSFLPIRMVPKFGMQYVLLSPESFPSPAGLVAEHVLNGLGELMHEDCSFVGRV